MDTKESLRRKLRQKRDNLSPAEVAAATGGITARLLAEIDWAVIRRVHIYTSAASWKEIGTTALRESLERQYPGLQIDTGSSSAAAPFPRARYDCIVVPVLGFDRAGHRLGLGKGWYDRFLAAQPHAKKIGLAYASAELDQLPSGPHDISLDVIATERELISRE